VSVHVWICRKCGKLSRAKRDPIAHERGAAWDTDYGRQCYYVWCGPFDRYVATLDTSKPQRDASRVARLGTQSRAPDEFPKDASYYDNPF
jgi:hypothetical protein